MCLCVTSVVERHSVVPPEVADVHCVQIPCYHYKCIIIGMFFVNLVSWLKTAQISDIRYGYLRYQLQTKG